MSVINQMLKDLDERQGDQAGTQNAPLPVVSKTSSKKVLFLIISAVVVVNIVGIIIWQLYTENQNLKSDKNTALFMAENTQVNAALQKPSNEAITKLHAANSVESDKELNRGMETATQSDFVEKKTQEPSKVSDNRALENNANSNEEGQDSGDVVQEKTTDTTKVDILEVETPIDSPKPQLSISRKQLTVEELTKQKITQAERAVQTNDLSKAEKLFEDVLLVSPDNKIARKQLAALWFGRQSYQPALNLLSQGIALAPDYMEYRLMKARIYLSQGQTNSAVEVLKALAALENVEYQSLLATSAQQAKAYQIAASSYRVLSAMQPNVGRWWLGLAVALDSNGQFSEAASAYQSAITTTELSENARQFVRQRLQELGG